MFAINSAVDKLHNKGGTGRLDKRTGAGEFAMFSSGRSVLSSLVAARRRSSSLPSSAKQRKMAPNNVT